MQREQFLQYVKSYIESDPEAAAYVADYVQQGLRERLNKAYERAVDMEVALAVLCRKHSVSPCMRLLCMASLSSYRTAFPM